MKSSALLYHLPYVASLGLTLLVAAYAWRRRHAQGARPGALAALSKGLWTAECEADLSPTQDV